MNSETHSTSSGQARNCQNCKKDFVIEPEDFNFYEKIKVPPPTFCPECRLKRKLIFRNERTLYKLNCKLCGKEKISIYSNDTKFTIYCNECWWSDKWDPLTYGIEYDFNKPFFEQFYQLSLRVPYINLFQKGSIDSPYTNHSDHNKNTYFSFNNGLLEDCMYCNWGINSKNIADCYSVFNSQLVYESQYSENCNNCKYVLFSKNCLDSSFLYNCRGCQNCFLSSNLRNQKYYIFNQPFSKEEYEKKLAEFNVGSYLGIESVLNKFYNELLPKTIRKYGIIEKSVNSTGHILFECKNAEFCFHGDKIEDSKFCVDDYELKDSYDTYESGLRCELQYECHGCNRTVNAKFANKCYDDHNLEYCDLCSDSSNLFGCVGVRGKSYCILNRQYTKEEYEIFVPKIIEHMKLTGEYGEFFPEKLSPFAYNETVAQEYFPLTKENAISQGYLWKNESIRDYKITKKTEEIPDDIKNIDENILQEIIECAHQGKCNEQCTTAFKVISEELQFYKKMNLPLPRLCPNCRHYERLKQRNPLKLWHRKCMKPGCQNEFETSYAPDRPEIVYCESCYNQEVA